jgi:hypothetical protein
MIGGTTKEEAHGWAGTKDGEAWDDPVAFAFLLSKGVLASGGYMLAEPTKIPIGDALVLAGPDLEMDGCPCYVGVLSRHPCPRCHGEGGWPSLMMTCPDCKGTSALGHHAVFWDGERVWDPHPESTGLETLCDYRVVDVWPLYELEGETKDALSKLKMA